MAGSQGRHGEAPELSEHQEKKADEEQSLDAPTTLEVIRREGEQELERTTSALAWSALAAGLSMGFSFITEAVLASKLPDAPWRPLVAKLGYAVGFLVVILGSQQLFTENTLTAVVPTIARRTAHALGRMLRLWGIVLVGNLIGTVLFAWVLARTGLFELDVHRAFEHAAREAIRADFALTLLRGIFAGWLIALMVWMLPAAQSAHVLVIVVMTWLVGAAGLPHIIAGSTEVAYLAARGLHGWGAYLVDFVVPTVIGNTIGGVTLVAALNHAQVTSGEG